jgi:hypothetical protein
MNEDDVEIAAGCKLPAAVAAYRNQRHIWLVT